MPKDTSLLGYCQTICENIFKFPIDTTYLLEYNVTRVKNI
jgi:hypothetical protein